MTIQTINIGGYANDGSGDDLRTAFQKVNANFGQLSGTIAIQSGTNLGSGTGLFAQKNLANLEFKSITSTDGSIVITPSAQSVNLSVVTDLATDTTPILGGNLDLGGFNIRGVGNIGILNQTPNENILVNGYSIPDLAGLLSLVLQSNSIVINFGQVTYPTGWTGEPDNNGTVVAFGGIVNPTALELDFGPIAN